MDRLESLSSTIQNITLYDIKSMYNQAKNVVLNISEMEAKVREATNDEPWGASSTLMQEIAQGTFHFQHFNEIMPSIYSRFMEKEAKQWRQIYKALQLLEYLIKHGSERVVDDARSHIATLKMLRNFHYIDDKGKDEGLNVRNRSRELVELLSDVEKIRSERRKAKTNKSKYVGVGNDGFSMSFDSGGGGRYGGFGNDSLGGGGSYSGNYSNDHVSGGSSSRGAGSSSFSDSRRGYEEYNAGDDEVTQPSSPPRTSGRNVARKSSVPTPKPVPEPVVDLLGGFDDDTFGAPAPAPSPGANKALPSVGIDDDDFTDFQAAPVQAPATSGGAAPQPAAGGKKPNLMDMLNTTPVQTPAHVGYTQPQQPAGYGMGGMGMGMGGGMGVAAGGMGMMGMNMGGHRQTSSISSNPSQFSSPILPQLQQQQPNLFGGSSAPMRPMTMGGSQPLMSNSSPKSPAAAQAKSANFDDLWSMSLGGGSSSSAKPGATTAGKSIKDLEKEKAQAGIWGAQQKQVGAPAAPAAPSAFGAFGNAAPPSTSGGDDLLL